MSANRLLLLPLIASVALTGCQIRKGDGVALNEYQDDKAEMSNKLSKLDNENARLQAQLDAANKQLAAAKGDQTLGKSFGKELSKGSDIEGTTATETGGLALSDDFAFAKGSADLNDDGKKTIEKIAARLNEGERSGTKVVVEGHTDDTPVARHATKEKYVDNWGLSAARSAAVIRALEAHKVDAKRIIGRFRGENAPRVVEGDKAKNRRVEIFTE